jgi:hypothetical protein
MYVYHGIILCIDKQLFVVPVIGHIIEKMMISFPCKEKTGDQILKNGGFYNEIRGFGLGDVQDTEGFGNGYVQMEPGNDTDWSGAA